ncbi:ABC transporter substrate-binding protein [Limibaculum sp. M0105]|uniref:ABC transporter substrate-binding protein n=1 Tax=Thermohalobaculum xanthum TaxID=2753746 RepID=A0A8J7M538_9RHOB|nr:ABC transporter substrate-binding protein [Thermohalobaculum xanthum]MBK0398651.1 ABC transporter substrate-binding protein [Thermohalobaculum xanthum]
MNELDRRQLLKLGAAGAALVAAPRAMAQTPKQGGTMRIGRAHGSTTDNLDPGVWENDFTIGQGFIYNNYLTEIDQNNGLAPELAESWEASPDAKQWVFKIRKGVTFHNGKDVTPDDVVASINYHRGPDSKSAAAGIVSQIEDIKADGDNVVVVLSGGNADFPYIVSDYHLAIMPAADGKIDWTQGIGCGPYKITSFEPGVRGTYEKHKDYWKSDRAHFDAVEQIAIVDAAARTNALLTGEVDVIDRVDLKTVARLKRAPGVAVEQTNGNQHYTLPMLSTQAPFDNNEIRLALKYALDREELLQKILQGYGTLGNDHPIGPANTYLATDLEQRAYDADKAKFHLKQAGLDNLTVDLHMSEAAFAGAVDAGILYSETAAKAGITINVVREPSDGYWSDVWMKKGWCGSYWGGRPTEDWMFSQVYQSGADWNEAFWSNERFDKLLKEGRAELDSDKRRDIYREMQMICRDEGGSVIPMFSSYVFARSTKLDHGAMASNWDMDGHKLVERWWFA